MVHELILFLCCGGWLRPVELVFAWCDQLAPKGVIAALILVSAVFVRPFFPGSGVLSDLGQIWVAWPGVRWVTGAG